MKLQPSEPLLQPRLGEQGVPWDEVAPVLFRLNVDLLAPALAGTNVEPVLAKLNMHLLATCVGRAQGRRLWPSLKKQGSSHPVLGKNDLHTCTPCSLEAQVQFRSLEACSLEALGAVS